LFVVCLIVSPRRGAFPKSTLAPGVGQKLLGFDRAMGLRKFCEKILDEKSGL
jgi:hypothetical protein